MFSGLLSTSDWISSSDETYSASNYSGYDFDLDNYLRECISYRLNIEKRKSIDLFQEYLKGI
jgi:hypothetical protein